MIYGIVIPMLVIVGLAVARCALMYVATRPTKAARLERKIEELERELGISP